jgi:hypothetical protein
MDGGENVIESPRTYGCRPAPDVDCVRVCFGGRIRDIDGLQRGITNVYRVGVVEPMYSTESIPST